METPKKQNLTAFILGGIFVLVLAVTVLYLAGAFPGKREMKMQEKGAATARVEYVRPNVTLAEFEQAKPGMHYDEVVRVFGAKGIPLIQDHLEEEEGVRQSVTTVMYQWMNADRSYATVVFQNDSLVEKSQTRLR